MPRAELIIKLKDLASKPLKAVRKGLADAGVSAQKASVKVKSFGDRVKGLGKLSKSVKIGIGVLATAIAFAGKSALSASGEFERYRVTMETLLGSSDKATELLNELEDFSSRTPLQLKNLVDLSTVLIGFGIESGKITDKLEILGNVAQGNQDKLTRLGDAYGKLKAKGRASLEEINRFSEAGVPLLKQLAENADTSTEGLFKMVSQGLISFEDVDRALTSLATGTGQFAGLLEKNSQTFEGVTSTLKDNFGLLAKSVGDKLLPSFKELAININNIVKATKSLVEGETKHEKNLKTKIDLIEKYAEELEMLYSRQTKINDAFEESHPLAETELKKIENQIKSKKSLIKALGGELEANKKIIDQKNNKPQGDSEEDQLKLRIQLIQELNSKEIKLEEDLFAKKKEIEEKFKEGKITQIEFEKELIDVRTDILKKQMVIDKKSAESDKKRKEEAKQAQLEQRLASATSVQHQISNLGVLASANASQWVYNTVPFPANLVLAPLVYGQVSSLFDQYASEVKFHDGGIVGKATKTQPDEVPATLQTGEQVLSRKQRANIDGRLKRIESIVAGDRITVVNIDGREVARATSKYNDKYQKRNRQGG